MFIYALADPESERIRYVGKSKDLQRRIKQHLNGARKPRLHVTQWIRSLQERALEPKMLILDICDIEKGTELERAWIALFQQADVPLTNLTDGGEGTSGYKRSAETRENDRQRQLGVKHSAERVEQNRQARLKEWAQKTPDERRLCLKCENLRMFQLGFKHSAESKEKMSKSHLGTKQSVEHVENKRRANLGHEVSPQTREKIREALKGRKTSPEMREKLRQSHLGHVPSLETREKLSVAMKAVRVRKKQLGGGNNVP